MKRKITMIMVLLMTMFVYSPEKIWATVTVTEPGTDDIQSSTSTVYYIYNESAGAYLTNGGTWGTHAIVADFQATTAFQFVTAGSGSFSSSWIHQQSRDNGSDLFPNNTSTGEVYCNGSKNTRWVITKSTDGTYYKMASTVTTANYSPSGTYLGLGDNNSNVRSNVTEDATTKWKFIISTKIDLFRAKMAMYKLIVIADGLVTAAADGDAKTTLSTALGTAQTNYASYSAVSDFTTGATTLKSAIFTFKTTGASSENPADVSFLGENMTFSKVTSAGEGGGYQDLPSGWTQTTFVGTGTTAGNYRTFLNTSNNTYYYENSKSSIFTGKVSQTISSIPAGIYKLTMKAYGTSEVYGYEQNDDYKATALPNSSAGEPISVEFTDTLIADNNSITFGLNSKATTASTSFAIGIGNVELSYIGAVTLDGVKSALNETITTATNLRSSSNPFDTEMGTQIANATSVYNSSTSTIAEVSQSTITLKTYIEHYKIGNGTMSSPYDASSLISAMGDDKGSGNYEKYQQTTALTQTISNMPQGYYRLSLVGFYRTAIDNAATYKTSWKDLNTTCKLSVTTGSNTYSTLMTNCWADTLAYNSSFTGTSKYPNAPAQMFTANNASGAYNNNEVCFYHSANGDITITLGNKEGNSGRWLCYRDWSLKYYGNTANALTMSESSSNTVSNNAYASTLTLTRTLKNGWNTVCLPFVVNDLSKFGTGATAYLIQGYNSEKGQVYFRQVEKMAANKPYLVNVTTAATSPISFDNVYVQAPSSTPVTRKLNGITCTGSYNSGTTVAKDNYILSANKFYCLTSDGTMNAFRGYFTVTDVSPAKELSLVAGDDLIEPTAINSVATDTNVETGNVYNLNGQLVRKGSLNGLAKGMYIINNKKVIITK